MQHPGRLRYRRAAASGPRVILVGAQRLTPAAVVVLMLEQPGDGAAARLMAHVEVHTAQADDRQPGAVEVVRSPSARTNSRRSSCSPSRNSTPRRICGWEGRDRALAQRLQYVRAVMSTVLGSIIAL